MATLRIFRDSSRSLGQCARAAAAGAVIAALALAAHAGRLAETPAAQASSLLAALGPGKLGALRAEPFDRRGASVEQLAARADAALAGMPLAHEPFMAVAAGRLRDGQALGPGDEARLREALRRNPRSREARVMLMRRAITASDLKGAVEQIAGLSQLNSEAAGVLLVGLGKSIRTPAQVDEALAGLRAHPGLYKPLLAGFVQSSRPADLTVRMVSGIPPEAFADRELRSRAIAAMVGAGAFARARALWGASHGKGAKGLLYSPDFADAKAPPPFNWELAADETGAAERDPAGGLMVDYYGRRPGRLVSQLLTLPPGTYVAAARYATLDGEPGALVLEVVCAGGSRASLAAVPLTAKAGPEQSAQARFTVPAAGCGGQTVAVSGRVQEMRNAQQIALRRISLSRASQP